MPNGPELQTRFDCPDRARYTLRAGIGCRARLVARYSACKIIAARVVRERRRHADLFHRTRCLESIARTEPESIATDRSKPPTRLWPSSSLPAVANVFFGAGGRSSFRDEGPLFDCTPSTVRRASWVSGLAFVVAAFRAAKASALSRVPNVKFCFADLTRRSKRAAQNRCDRWPPLPQTVA